MAIYRPDIKPPTWGSPDAMLYAVRANAEQMELDHRKFLHLFPMLEGAGLQTFDFGAGVNCATNFNVWEEGGPVCQRDTDRDINIPSDSWWFYGPYTEGLSIIARHRSTSSAPSEQYIFSRGNTASAPRAPVGLYQTSALNDSVLLCKSATATRSITASKSFPFGTHITVGATITPQKIFSAYAGEVVNSVDYSSETWGGTTSDAAVVYNKQGTFDREPNIIGGCVYVIKEALTYDKMQEMFATPYALFMPVSRPVYFDLGAGGTTGDFSAPSQSVTPGISAGTLAGAQAGALMAPSVSLQPSISAGTLTGQQSATFNTPSQSTQPSIQAGTLAGASAGTFQAPSLSTQPAISSGVLVGQAGGNFTGPSLFVQPSVSAGSLVGLSAGSFTSPGVSTQPTVAAGSLAGQQSGAFAAPSVSAQPSVQAGALLGSQSGNFLGPSLVVSSSVTAATLQSLGSGLFSAPQVATRPVVATGPLIGASVGAAQAPPLSTAPVISAGVLVGNQSGNFLGPSLSLRPDVEAGTLAGGAASSGGFVSPRLSLHASVLAGVLVGDTVTILPEEFNADSRITNHFAANSPITTEFVAVSRLELGRIQNNG